MFAEGQPLPPDSAPPAGGPRGPRHRGPDTGLQAGTILSHPWDRVWGFLVSFTTMLSGRAYDRQDGSLRRSPLLDKDTGYEIEGLACPPRQAVCWTFT